MRLLYLKLVLIFLFMMLIVGCALTLPAVQKKDISGVAIRVHMKILSFKGKYSSGVERIRPDYLFFIRLDGIGDSHQKTNFKVSNYCYESLKVGFQTDTIDSFVLNIEPGIYAAVGAVGTGLSSNEKFLVFFPNNMIEKSTAVVRPNTITFLGEYILDRMTTIRLGTTSTIRLNRMSALRMDWKLKKQLTMGTYESTDAEDHQKYYFDNYLFDLIMLEGNEPVISKYQNLLPLKASLSRTDRKNLTEIGFLKKHIQTFKDSDWLHKVNNRLSMLEN